MPRRAAALVAASAWPGVASVPSPFCAKYHPIHDAGVCDPSGPLQDATGLWHTWENKGEWSHWTSRDLIHWSGSFTANSTNFGPATGSVSSTPSGIYAFWPIMTGGGHSWTGKIGSAVAKDAGLTEWEHRGPTIQMPSGISIFAFRDPVRAFQYNSKWYVGVGCGSSKGAQFCLFEARDDTLAHFIDRGSLFTTNMTFGNVDKDVVWHPTNVTASMMECPDLFPLGDKWVLIGSLFKTNQWWVGSLHGDPPRFVPEQVGIIDYGNWYAAKTGSSTVQSGSSRRLLFGFTGWSEPTMPPGCGRALVIPRELRVEGSELIIDPIPEVAALRKPGSSTAHILDGGDLDSRTELAPGSQVEVRMNCTAASMRDGRVSGKVGLRTLATAGGEAYTEIGYDFGAREAYADHTRCCAEANSIVQRVPHPGPSSAGAVNIAVFVDGGVIEAFVSGRVFTPLVSPDLSAGGPSERRSFILNTAGAACMVQSWQLSYDSAASATFV